MDDLSVTVKSILNKYDATNVTQLIDLEDFEPLVKELVMFIRMYKPIENIDYLCFQANYEFSTFVCKLEDEGKVTPKLAKEAKRFLQHNLRYYLGWSPLKPELRARQFDKVDRWLKNNNCMSNPFETLSPAYMLDMMEFSIEFFKYVHSKEFLKIMQQRLAMYYEQDYIEGAMSGVNNRSKINCAHEMLKLLRVNSSEEPALLLSLCEEVDRLERELNGR